MSVTPASFRQQFGEFANLDIYSDFAIGLWTQVSTNFLDPVRWGTLLDYGTSLYVAHRLALSRRDILAASGTGIPGGAVGVLTSKSVDKVAASYDTGSVTLEGAGQYNLTRYGIELWQLMGQMGAGGVQLTGAIVTPGDGWAGFY